MLWDSQALGWKVGRAFMGRLISGPYSLGVSRQRVGPTFLGRLVAGPFPFEVLGSGRIAMGIGPRPKVPTIPPFFYRGGGGGGGGGGGDKPSPVGKIVSLTIISWGIVYY